MVDSTRQSAFLWREASDEIFWVGWRKVSEWIDVLPGIPMSCQELRQAGVAAWNRLFDEAELDLILIPGYLCLGLTRLETGKQQRLKRLSWRW